MTYGRPRVAQIRRRGCPMLVLGAAADAIVPPTEIERTARAYGAPCRIFPHMAHDMMLERDWADVAEYIREWLVPATPT